ncbi:hypothetical protein QZH41_008013 [Actinostola sp. cb2023]|nr:hypothetical protein QZH41_008013 [Actinostola sp. cb2023]
MKILKSSICKTYQGVSTLNGSKMNRSTRRVRTYYLSKRKKLCRVDLGCGPWMWPDKARYGPIWPDQGPIKARYGPIKARCGPMWPEKARCGPIWPDMGRQQFNPDEDSTAGVKVERSLTKQKGDQWFEEGNDESFDVISTANEVAGYLNPNENNGTLSEKALVHQESEEKFFTDDIFKEDNEYSANSIPSIAKSASDDEVELVNTGRDDCQAVPVEKEEKLEPSYTETRSDIQVPPNVTETVTKILRNDRMEEDNYSYITFDFAGQPVYSATHPVFFSSKAIYILVYSLEDKLDDQANPIFKQGSYKSKLVDRCPMTNMDHIEFWLSFVQSASIQQEHDGSLNTNEDVVNCLRHFQPVFLVGTHADKPFDNDNPANIAHNVFHRLEGKPNADSQCLVRKSYIVNNQVSGSGEEDEDVKKLRDDILEEVEKLPYINEDIPIRWLRFKSELSFLVKSSKKRYLSHEEAKEIASKCTINGKDEFDTLLNYLHDLKSIIYFEDTKMVIIDIQWLLDVFVKVVTVQPYLDWDVKYKESWKKLEEDGILEKALVEHLWHDLVDEVNTIDSLLLIMERFSIICQWNDVYLVPSMMNCNAKDTGDLVGQNFKSPLVILFKSPHLPLGIFPRFFDVGPNGCYDVVFTSDMRTITVDVIEEEDVDENFDSLKTFCRSIMQFLTETLTNMKQKFPWKGCEKYQFCIRCPICIEASESCEIHKKKGCSRDSCQHLISESELIGGRTPRCRKNPTKKNVSIKQDVYSKWFSRTNKSATKQNQLQETSLTSNSCTSPLHEGRDKWKPFAELVGVSSDDIEFYDKRTTNPAYEILKDHCNNWSVEELYDVIVKCDANAIADNYL